MNGEATVAEGTSGSPRGSVESTSLGVSPWLSADVVRRHVEIAKSAVAAFNRRDTEAWMPVISGDMELHPAVGGAFVGATTYSGKEGFRRYLEELMEVIEDFQIAPLRYSAWRDYLIVANRISGHGTRSGVDIATEMTFIWQVREEQVVWGATFFSRTQALQAIGATEQQLKAIE